MRATQSILVYESISAGGLGAIGTEAAALLAQGRAMRDALAADLAQIDGLSVTCAAAEYAPLPGSLARVGVVPPDADVDAADWLGRVAAHYDRVWAIAPESAGMLAALAAAVGEARWIGCSVPAIVLTASKNATRSHLAAHGVAVPSSWRPGDPLPRGTGRWVVKPDDGAGTEHTRVHAQFAAARADLLERLAQGAPATMEHWIDGPALSMALLCRRGRAELLAINHQRIAARVDGTLAYLGVDCAAEPVDDARGRTLEALATRIAAAVPGLAGYVGVDLVWQPSRGPVVIEINPRLTCAYVGLSAALGRNLAGEILRSRCMETTHDAPP